MKTKTITTKTKPSKILEYFKEAQEKGTTVNMKTETGFIYIVGGILNKLENHNHFIAINNEWVKV